MNPKANNSTRRLWGIVVGSLFAAAVASAQTYQVVHSFKAGEGSDPHPGIIQMTDGFFAGTTVGGYGTLFKMDALGQLETIHTFELRDDGGNPHGSLFQEDLLQANGPLFGTTMNGGDGLKGGGTVFKIDNTGAFTTCKVFNPHAGGPDGEGGEPQAALIQASDGKFYGVTYGGGHDGFGTIFQMDASCNVTTLHHFSGYDGAYPYEALLEMDGVLYGTTSSGGAWKQGTVFRIDKSGFSGSHHFAVIHDFAGIEGSNPQASLVAAKNGFLYGTTRDGGRNGLGTVFQMNPSGTSFGVIHHFEGFEGSHPYATLIQARDGHLYGTMYSGGVDCYATYGGIFRIHASPEVAGGGFEVVHRFMGADFADGAYPQSRLFEASDGGLYGTTSSGGPEDLGVVFRLVFVQVGSIRPTSGRASGVAIAIEGANFLPGASVNINGIDAPNTLFANDSLILATTPALVPGTLNDVMVDNADNTRGGVLKGFFADVAREDRFAPWIEQLHAEGITSGCDGGYMFCPNDPMTREQMAVSLLKAKYGFTYQPPACQGIFQDVPCTADYAPWIEKLYADGITAGCNGGHFFCPDAPSTRGQTAVFLTKTFSLP